jgi:hypothetical protein
MSLPTATHASRDYDYYLRNGPVVSISTLVVSTITADVLGVLPEGSGYPSFIVAGQAGNILIETDVLNTNTLVHKDKVFDTNESTLQTFNQGFAAGSTEYLMEYIETDLDGTTHTKASVEFVSSIGGGASGGIIMTAEDGLQFSVGNSTVGAYQAGAAVVTSINAPDAKISHIVGSDEVSKLEFTQNASTISLVSGAGAFVEVGETGIGLQPGMGNFTTMYGPLDANNNGIVNVSTINGAPPIGAYIARDDDDTPSTITFSNVATTLLSFPSTIQGNWYRISAVLGIQTAPSSAGGVPTDYCEIYIGDTGATSVALDTITQPYVNPLYNPPQASYTLLTKTFSGVVQDNNGGGLELNALANNATEWSTIMYSVVAEDLGKAGPIPNNFW